MKAKKRTLILLGLVILAVIAIAYGFIRAFSQPSPEQRYRLQNAEQGDITQTVSANGTQRNRASPRRASATSRRPSNSRGPTKPG